LKATRLLQIGNRVAWHICSPWFCFVIAKFEREYVKASKRYEKHEHCSWLHIPRASGEHLHSLNIHGLDSICLFLSACGSRSHVIDLKFNTLSMWLCFVWQRQLSIILCMVCPATPCDGLHMKLCRLETISMWSHHATWSRFSQMQTLSVHNFWNWTWLVFAAVPRKESSEYILLLILYHTI